MLVAVEADYLASRFTRLWFQAIPVLLLSVQCAFALGTIDLRSFNPDFWEHRFLAYPGNPRRF